MGPLCKLPLYVCLLTAPALAQSPNAPPLPPLFDVGVSFVNDYVLSGQNGAALEGTYYSRDRMRKWGGLNRDGIFAKYSGTGNIGTRLYTYMIGLRWGIQWGRLYLYAGVALGGSRADVRGLNNAGVLGSLVRNGFAASTTSGIELSLGEHYAVKLLEAEFPSVMVPMPSTGHGSWENDFRSSAGIVYRFERRQH